MKQENVLKYYVLCNRLKNTIRSGWKVWKVDRERVESVAEHIFSVQQLAIAMYSEFGYDIDIQKVIFMLAIHETEETLIGDLTPFDTTDEDKQESGHRAILKALEPLNMKDKLVELILEFDARETKEAMFAHMCDKLECDLQCKMYDEENCVNFEDDDLSDIKDDPRIIELVKAGNSWSSVWLKSDLQKIKYDDNFRSMVNYAIEHNLHDLLDL